MPSLRGGTKLSESQDVYKMQVMQPAWWGVGAAYVSAIQIDARRQWRCAGRWNLSYFKHTLKLI